MSSCSVTRNVMIPSHTLYADGFLPKLFLLYFYLKYYAKVFQINQLLLYTIDLYCADVFYDSHAPGMANHFMFYLVYLESNSGRFNQAQQHAKSYINLKIFNLMLSWSRRKMYQKAGRKWTRWGACSKGSSVSIVYVWFYWSTLTMYDKYEHASRTNPNIAW